jgi:hypothetical protein
VRLEGAQQNQKLAYEPVGAGQSDRGQSDNQQEGGQQRELFREPAEGRQVGAVPPHVQEPGQEEKPRGGEAQIDHGQQAALQTLEVQREHAQHTEAEVADAAEGQQTAQVRLDQRHDRSVQDRDQRQGHHDRHHALAL